MIGLRPRLGNPVSFSDYVSFMLGKPRIRLNNLKNSPRFLYLGLNSIIDSIGVCSRYLTFIYLVRPIDLYCIQGPVFESIVSLTKSLVKDSLSLIFLTKISVLIVFCCKKKLLTFSAKIGRVLHKICFKF